MNEINSIDKLPRILVISYACFSKSEANGKTHANLFYGWDKDKLAQFYCIDSIPDFSVCENYFRLTDSDMLSSFKFKKGGQIVTEECKASNFANSKIEKIKRKKSKINLRFIRNTLWNFGLWKNKKLFSWIENFKPQAVLVTISDNVFLEKFAAEISKKYSIPLFAYSSEDYALKKYKEHGFWGKLMKRQVRRNFKKVAQNASHFFFNCKMLEDSYRASYDIQSSVIYNPSINFGELPDKVENDPLVISYVGNISLGRETSLIDIAETLFEIDSNLKLNLYGNATSEVLELLLKHSNIVYGGVLPFEDAVRVMRESDIILDVLSFDEKHREDKKHGFSTKVGDSLAIGTCLFAYAPKEFASTRYFIENGYYALATDKTELKGKLSELLQSKTVREKCIAQAKVLAAKNHDIKKNSNRLQKTINSYLT